ncbi:MAG: bifunctional DNA-formamidopyrimidine glycosylase/DNA-(apurinic or apyrimidinic site) lyase [Gemmatimonadota bacterium]
MPELPEVETIRADLDPLLQGRRIEGLRIHKPDIVLGGITPSEFGRLLRGRTFLRVSRRAKYLLFELDRDTVLQTHLRMTGRFAIGPSLPGEAGFRHIAAEFRLDDGRTLFYDDVRRLGGFLVLSGEEWARVAARLGPEPLGRFSSGDLLRIFHNLRAPIKNVLLDQRRLAGVGNIYASEALFRAEIDPRRPAGSLTSEEARRLHRSVRRVLREALRSSGTTLRDYRAVSGASGQYQNRLRVYGREGEKCPRCRKTIERIVQAGRSSFLCSSCQN